MPSLIPGFEYDIFISYRQKDNKGDRWVSEFVEALKTELESTFKEEISVYFDINPHDGLLETHDVDASLKEKLKCLVFIPVLSRTYCDPKSFAWENEFKSFAEQASKDQFGLKVRLPNGNIANRIFPVRVHDLDADDIRLCESVTGGVLHEIEFIYRSTGVNRPLRPKEDNPHENMNKTFYRDQINKTVLAIKEIILGLKGEPDMSMAENSAHREQELEFYEVKKPAGSPKKKLLIGAGILSILIIATLFFWPGLIGRHNLEGLVAKDGKISLAIMPFQNMTNDTLWNVWQDGIQNILITSLSNLNEFKVRQLETVTNILKSKGLTDYASLTPSVASSISRKLETNVNITGSIKQSGSTIRVNAQLVDTKKGEAFKSFQIDGIADSILTIVDSLSQMIQDFLQISVLQKEEPNSERYPPFPTKSPDAYKCLLYARKASAKNEFPAAREWYLKALGIDSTLFGAMSGMAISYYNENKFKEGKEWVLKLYRNLDKMTMEQKLGAKGIYGLYFEGPKENIEYNKQLIEIDDQCTGPHFNLGDWYLQIEQYDKAITEFEKGLEIYRKWDVKPDLMYYQEPGQAYHRAGRLKEEKKLYRKARKDYPGAPDMLEQYAYIALEEGDTVEANRYIKEWISIRKEQSWSDAKIASAMAWIYSMAGNYDKEEECLRKALALEPENGGLMVSLAYFLIEKDRNINEGIELVDKVLKKYPDAMNPLSIKGWGLYKQGKYQEALDLLQKSWDLRMKISIYNHTAYLHLEEAKKAVAVQK